MGRMRIRLWIARLGSAILWGLCGSNDRDQLDKKYWNHGRTGQGPDGKPRAKWGKKAK